MKRKIMTILLAAVLTAGCALPASSAGASGTEAAEPAQPGKEQLVIIGKENADVRSMQNKLQKQDEKEAALIPLVDAETAEKEYTLMIYMVGSDLESRNGAATGDLNEIENAGIDFSRMNVIVCAGGSRRWNSAVPNTQNSVLDMSKDWDERIVANTKSSADMGAPECLASFINYCTEFYPAKRYSLICWDHGGGPVYGYGYDELHSYDSLLLQEMKEAMERTQINSENKLEFIGFDACLMGSLETASTWQDYAQYMIASQETEAGAGWDYSFLHDLPSLSAKEAAESIVDSYGSYYEENRSQFFAPDATLAALDLSCTSEAEEKLNALMTAVDTDIQKGSYADIRRSRVNTKGFGLNVIASRDESYDLIDLKNFAEQLQGRYPAESSGLITALEKMIVHNTSNTENANGLSLYFPCENRELYQETSEITQTLSETYRNCTDSFAEKWNSSDSTDWKLAQPEASEDGMTLQLEKEQADNMAAAYYTLMIPDENGFYRLALCNVRIDADADRTLHVPQDPEVFSAVTETCETEFPWVFLQTQRTQNGAAFRTLMSNLSVGQEFDDYDPAADPAVTITVGTEGDDVRILDVVTDDETTGLSGKGSVDTRLYRTVIDGPYGMYRPTRGADGNMKPFYEWESGGYMYYALSLDQDFSFVKKNISEYNKQFCVQFLVRDINGNMHGSEVIPMGFEAEKLVEVQTEKGKMTFSTADDHAELVCYEGEDTELVIPAEAGGVPVTLIRREVCRRAETLERVVLPETVLELDEDAFSYLRSCTEFVLNEGLQVIGDHAFSSCTALQEISLPSTLTHIGRAAFRGCDLQDVTLPAGLQKIGDIVFLNNKQLAGISFDGENENYKTEDGVLYTADGKTLIEMPAGREGSFAIPEGVETVAYGAFAFSRLSHAGMPETLKKISSCAFFGCTALEGLELPSSLEHIGHYAFKGLSIYYDPKGQPVIETLRIPANVSFIGEKAFIGLNIKSFEVDENNRNYASSGGFLCNRAKTVILNVPAGCESPVTVPDGITTLNRYIFSDLPADSEFILPDSVYMIAEDVFNESWENDKFVYKVKIHCSEGSAAQTYAEMYGIEYDHICDPEALTKKDVTVTEGQTEMTFRIEYGMASLTSCLSDDTVITIPAEVEGMPVTQITDISKDLFADVWSAYDAEEIILPETLESIDVKAYSLFRYAQSITVPETNEHLKCEDGVLFTKDGKILLFCTAGKDDETYNIPEGVKEIGEEAFASNRSIGTVVLPSSTQVIRRKAFYGYFFDDDMKEVILNEGLKTIEKDALYREDIVRALPSTVTDIGDSALRFSQDQPELSIPEKLTHAGMNAFGAASPVRIKDEYLKVRAGLEFETDAFSGILFKGFDVPEGDEQYAADGIFLTDRIGKNLLLVASDTGEDIYIPEGIEALTYGCMHTIPNAKRVYIPASVISMHGAFDLYYSEEDEPPTVYVRKGSPLIEYLEKNDLPWEEWKD
ncbi:MAG: leucine-rich repeat protein [Solobacterium sp.]|nr:leucine-rich repeat protein [Solobacterium sp.]